MKGITPEMMEKAKNAKNAEELLALAKENGVAMSEEEAQMYYAQLNPTSGELDDDELDNVAGGACNGESGAPTCPMCGTTLTQVWYADPDLLSYNLCYGCGNYGLWHSGSGTRELPEARAKYLVEKTSGQ